VDGIKCKRPARYWKQWQSEIPGQEQITEWFVEESLGIAVVCGPVSGNLEIIDIDEGQLMRPYCDLVEERAPGLMARLCVVESPRPGYQIAYRCEIIGRNQPLAAHEVPAKPEEIELKPTKDKDGKQILDRFGKPRFHRKAHQNDAGQWVVKKVRIETRGSGGYACAVGSPARIHRLNKPYRFVNLDYSRLPTITPEEREVLFDVARSFDRMPPKPVRPIAERPQRPEFQRVASSNGCRACNDFWLCSRHDFDERGNVREVLENAGWVYVGEGQYGESWRHPNTENDSSATLFPDGGFLVFSTSTEFEAGQGYRPHAVFAVLECNGDFSRAARVLGNKGFGQKRARNAA
jgi:hypothetical protein